MTRNENRAAALLIWGVIALLTAALVLHREPPVQHWKIYEDKGADVFHGSMDCQTAEDRGNGALIWTPCPPGATP